LQRERPDVVPPGPRGRSSEPAVRSHSAAGCRPHRRSRMQRPQSGPDAGTPVEVVWLRQRCRGTSAKDGSLKPQARTPSIRASSAPPTFRSAGCQRAAPKPGRAPGTHKEVNLNSRTGLSGVGVPPRPVLRLSGPRSSWDREDFGVRIDNKGGGGPIQHARVKSGHAKVDALPTPIAPRSQLPAVQYCSAASILRTAPKRFACG